MYISCVHVRMYMYVHVCMIGVNKNVTPYNYYAMAVLQNLISVPTYLHVHQCWGTPTCTCTCIPHVYVCIIHVHVRTCVYTYYLYTCIYTYIQVHVGRYTRTCM